MKIGAKSWEKAGMIRAVTCRDMLTKSLHFQMRARLEQAEKSGQFKTLLDYCFYLG
jgi:hypothetical protein